MEAINAYMIFAGLEPIAAGQAEYYIFRTREDAVDFIEGMRRASALPLPDWHYKECIITFTSN